MNNAEVHQAIVNSEPLFYWIHLTNGEQYLVPFVCQRCSNCCRVVFDVPCRYFKEPSTCTIYERRPHVCKDYPLHAETLAQGIDCPGYLLSQKAIAGLGQDTGYWLDSRSSLIFKPSTGLQKAIAKLEQANLPEDFIDRFIQINS